MSAVRIMMFAPNGRMGRAIVDAVGETDGFEIADDEGDVLVDFSAPDALEASLGRAVSAAIPILVGTTGLDARAHRDPRAADGRRCRGIPRRWRRASSIRRG